MKAATFNWLILMALTALSFGMAEAGVPGGATLVPVLLATLFKGRIVIDRFMALQGVGGAWRWVVLGWLLLVLGLIGYAFQHAQT
ncbi:MAG: cytochrome C oxidase subunit IV family protein [Thiobacillus sp.]|nr:cytochrome C oxidase subunit IV family protein [Thiobacillus sp.]